MVFVYSTPNYLNLHLLISHDIHVYVHVPHTSYVEYKAMETLYLNALYCTYMYVDTNEHILC